MPSKRARSGPAAAAIVLFLLLGAAWPISPSHAASIAGVTVPDSMQVDGQTLILNGLGVRTYSFLKIKIYVAALYLQAKSYDGASILASPQSKVIALHYIHSGSKEQVQDHYREGAENNCGNGNCDAALQADFDKLVASATAVQEGDTTLFIATNRYFRVVFNGRPIITINNPKLGTLMISGFIGTHPPSEDLRAALLGLQ